MEDKYDISNDILQDQLNGTIEIYKHDWCKEDYQPIKQELQPHKCPICKWTSWNDTEMEQHFTKCEENKWN